MLREEHRRRLFSRRVLEKIVWSTREKATGGWRELHCEELHDL
jgi:hypothetical protein